jgi:hypothetical protein
MVIVWARAEDRPGGWGCQRPVGIPPGLRRRAPARGPRAEHAPRGTGRPGPCHRLARPRRMARRARPRRGRGPPPWTRQLELAVESVGNPRQTRPGPHIHWQVGKPSTPRRLGLSFSALPSFIAPEFTATSSRAPFNPMWRGPGADAARSRHSRRCQPECGAHLIILTGTLTSCRWTMNRSLPMSMFEIT